MITDLPTRLNTFLIGLDLGQSSDWTAIAVAEQIPYVNLDPHYQLRHLERWHPRRYPDVVERVAVIARTLTAPQRVSDGFDVWIERPVVRLVVDRTGVGRAVGDLFAEAHLPVELDLVTITAGNQVTRVDGAYGVPKRDLAGVVAVLLQTNRLEIAADLAHADTLRAELKNFRVKISAAGRDTYGAGDDWREGNHDDLVLATALALWKGEQGGGEFADLPQETVSALVDWFG